MALDTDSVVRLSVIYDVMSVTNKSFMLNVIMMNVIMLIVVMLNVVAPFQPSPIFVS